VFEVSQGGSVSAIHDAEAALDSSRPRDALAVISQVPLEGLDVAEVAAAKRVACLASFRVGELAHAARSAREFTEHVSLSLQDTLAYRFDTLAVAALAEGELANYEDCFGRVREVLGLASRLGGLAYWVRARGTAASAFALLGDVWAAKRILTSLAKALAGEAQSLRLEATVRNNHASVCLQMARLARLGGEPQTSAEALSEARASVERACEIARELNDSRLVAFGRLHTVELDFLSAGSSVHVHRLDEAIHEAERDGLRAHWLQLVLLRAEVARDARKADWNLPLLRAAEESHAGQALAMRIKLYECVRDSFEHANDLPAARQWRIKAEELRNFQELRRVRAQSLLVSTRLELEHLFAHRPAA
jgi:hypothetical protein